MFPNHVVRLLALSGSLALATTFTHALNAAGLDVAITDGDGEPVLNAVATLMQAGAQSGGLAVSDITVAATGLMVAMNQRDQAFVPDVLPVLVGTRVTFPNQDDTQHHVYSFSPPKQFEMRLNAGSVGEGVLFDVPGVVAVGCNIHDHMVGHIYVASSPLFAVSDDQGLARFDDLPPGTYTLDIWHQRLNGRVENYSQTVTLLANVDREANVQIRLKRQRTNNGRRY